jgi:hypothetical protein
MAACQILLLALKHPPPDFEADQVLEASIHDRLNPLVRLRQWRFAIGGLDLGGDVIIETLSMLSHPEFFMIDMAIEKPYSLGLFQDLVSVIVTRCNGRLELRSARDATIDFLEAGPARAVLRSIEAMTSPLDRIGNGPYTGRRLCN